MIRILLYFILAYFVVKIIRGLLTFKGSQEKAVHGNSQQKKKIDINENDIDDAQYEDIEE